jgi:hypothetical protein
MLVQLGADKEAKSDRGMMPLHHAAVNGHVETVTVLLQLGLDKEAKTAHGSTALHCAAVKGHVEVIKALVEAGAEVESLDVRGETPLQLSVRSGQRQAARELEHTARTRKEAATSERAQQAAEAAERNAAALIEEEKREQAAKAQSKVRSVELVPACGLSDAVSLAHGWEASRSAEGQGQGQGWWWRAVRQGGGCGEQQRRGEHLAWGGLPAQYATINKRCPPHHGGGCSAGCVSLGGGRERCAAACWRRQEGEGTRAQRAAEAAPDGGGEGGAAGSDRGDVRRGVREPSVVDVHRMMPKITFTGRSLRRARWSDRVSPTAVRRCSCSPRARHHVTQPCWGSGFRQGGFDADDRVSGQVNTPRWVLRGPARPVLRGATSVARQLHSLSLTHFTASSRE